MKKMMIALDGSQESETILPIALTISVKCGYEPILLAVWETAPEEMLEAPQAAEMIEHGTEYLQSYLHTLAPTLDEMNLPVTLEVRAGHPAVEVIGAAKDQQTDIIAMCTHGRRAATGERRGSVADKVLRGSTVPVLALGPLASEAPAGEPMHIRGVMVPLDGSAEAEDALPLAIDLAAGLHAEIHLVRVVTPVIGNYGLDLSRRFGKELNREREKTARAYLEAVRSQHKDKIISTEVLPGFPAAELRRFVQQSPIDLVVMTSHSRYAAGLWTLGGVADSLIDGPAPVLLVKPG